APELQRQIVKPPSWWMQWMERRFTFTLPQLAGAGALAIALMTFAFVNAFHQNARPLNFTQASTALLHGEDELKHDIEHRMNTLKARQVTWDPQIREIFERNLIKIDDSLKSSRQTLLEHPSDTDHQQ